MKMRLKETSKTVKVKMTKSWFLKTFSNEMLGFENVDGGNVVIFV